MKAISKQFELPGTTRAAGLLLAFLLAWSCLGVVSAPWAQVQRFPGAVYVNSSGGPGSITIADVTGDDVLDIVATAFFTGEILIHPGLGDASFEPARPFLVGGTPVSIVSVDLDRDGKMDLAWLDDVTGWLHWAYGTEAVQTPFNRLTSLTEEDESSSIDVLDIGSDGWPDLVVALSGADRLAIHLNDGAGNLLPADVYDCGDHPEVVKALFWPGNSEPHFFVRQTGFLSQDIGVYAGSSPSLSQLLPVNGTLSIQPGDWNSDPWPDLVVLEGNGQRTSVFVGDATGLMSLGPSWSFPTNATSVALLDSVGPLRRMATAETERLRVGLYEGVASFPPHMREAYFVGQGIEEIELAPLDVEPGLEMALPLFTRDLIAVLKRRGAGYEGFRSILMGKDLRSLEWVDPGAEHGAKLAVLSDVSPELRIYEPRGATLRKTLDLPIGTAVGSMRWGYVDADGLIDLVVHRENTAIDVYLSDAVGFLTPVTLPLPNDISSFDLGDVDGDGSLDLAVADRTESAIGIFSGDGAGNFSPAFTVDTAVLPDQVRLRDLDLDDRADMVLLDGSNFAFIFFSESSFFTSPIRPVSGNSPRRIEFGFYNADIYPDIAVTNSGAGGSFSVFRSTGARIYQIGTSSESIPGGALELTTIDVNSDGLDDLAFSAPSATEVSIRFATGSGRFSLPLEFRAAGLAVGIASGDVDADGLEDLMILDSRGESLTLALHDPDPLVSVDDGSILEEPSPVSSPSRALLAPPYPNPSAGPVMIRYRAASQRPSRLIIVDARGRLVRELKPTLLEDGWAGARWNGLDGRGRSVARGRYFAQLLTDGRRLSAPLIRLRP